MNFRHKAKLGPHWRNRPLPGRISVPLLERTGIMHKAIQIASGFAELGIEASWLQALGEIGFQQPTDIQRAMIVPALAGRDILGQARTGTGKTAAFGLPICHRLDPTLGMQAIVLVPTRELAVQVSAEIQRFNTHTRLRCVPVYGGQKIAHQLHQLGRKPHIIVGTPGRVMDFLGRRAFHFDEIRAVVLDEVDRMLDIGFRDDIRKILSQVRTEHQTIFVSATLSDEITRLAKQYMKDPLELNVSRDQLTVDEVKQYYITVQPWDKSSMLLKLLERDDPKLTIVFCNTKHGARKLANRLHAAGINAKEIHGDLIQQKRDRVMEKFRKHQIKVLVATDLAARGIDVHNISHIINYDIPDDSEIYVHRIGRTARAGCTGRAYTLVTPEQGKQLTEIEKLINKMIEPATVEGFASTPPPRDSRTPEPSAAPAEPPPSRYAQSVFGGTAPDGTPTEAPVRKTLGSKFRPARRRRR